MSTSRPTQVRAPAGVSRVKSLVGSTTLGLLGVAAFAFGLRRYLLTTGEWLGHVSHRLAAPFHAIWTDDPLGLWSIPLLLAVVVAIVVRRHLLGSAPWTAVFRAIALFLLLVAAAAVQDGWTIVNGRLLPTNFLQYSKAHLDPSGDVDQVDRLGPAQFMARYHKPRLFDRLAIHTRSHPPGAVMLQWGFARILGEGVWSSVLATLAFATLLIPLTFLLGRELYDEGIGKVAAVLLAVSPTFVMYGTYMDGAYAVLLIVPVVLFLRASRRPGSPATAVLLGISMAAATLVTYTAAFIALLLGCLASLRFACSGAAGARSWKLLGVGLAAAVLCYVPLVLLVGYDPWATLRASIRYNEDLMGPGFGAPAKYLLFGLSHLVAFGTLVGIPAVVLLIELVRREWCRFRASACPDPFVASVVSLVLVMAFATVYRMEVERIWLFLAAPLMVLAARSLEAADPRRAETAFILLLSNLLLAEIALQTPG